MDAVIEETVPIRCAEVAVAPVAMACLVEIAGDLAAFELIVQKHVDDTGDGARTVRGRGTTRYRVDARDEDLRDEVQIEAVALVAVHHDAAIEQHQVRLPK